MHMTSVSSDSVLWIIGQAFIWFLAAVGGLVVIRGLWLERQGAKSGYFHLQQRKTECGETWVIVGVAIEVVVGVAFAAKDGLQARETTRHIAAIDPHNQPILSATGYAMFIMRSFSSLPDTNLLRNIGASGMHIKNMSPSRNWQTWVNLGMASHAVKDQWGLECLADNTSPSITVISNKEFLRLDIYFGESEFGWSRLYESFTNTALTSSEADVIGFWLPVQGEIIMGKAELNINGGLMKQFQIPPQRTYGVIATSVASNGAFAPLKLPFEKRKQ